MIVFSKDRPLQLHAFLRSFEAQVTPFVSVHVLFLATSPAYDAAYVEMFREFGLWVVPMRQSGSFKADLLDLLDGTGNVAFFVDDMVFVRPWKVEERAGLSLRLGLHLTCNYSTGDTPQPLPPYVVQDGLVSWRWADGQLAWSYPLSVDGHVFDLAEVRGWIEAVPFTSPNTLESSLQTFQPLFAERMGSCYEKTVAVNIPWNRVQTDWSMRCAGPSSATSAEELLEYWEDGFQIDLSRLYGVVNESVHQEFPLVLEDR